MNAPAPPGPVDGRGGTLIVVYAVDVPRVAAFYRHTLGLADVEGDDGFVLLGDGAIEVAVVRIPAPLAADIRIAVPPALREATPIKLSFRVDDFDAVRVAAASRGGGLGALETAWHWRGELHLDGYDPEGNVVQFRRRDPAGAVE